MQVKKGTNSKCGANEVLKTVEQNKELWELFTKKEEYDPALLDKYGRFPYYLSRQKEYGS